MWVNIWCCSKTEPTPLVLMCQPDSSRPYFILIFVFLHLFSHSVSVGVGVKGTAFPVGTVKSRTRGSNQTQTSKWCVVFLPPHPAGACEWRLVCPIFISAATLWAGVPHWEPTRLRWKCWDNETLWGQQTRHLPSLFSHIASMYVKLPTSEFRQGTVER